LKEPHESAGAVVAVDARLVCGVIDASADGVLVAGSVVVVVDDVSAGVAVLVANANPGITSIVDTSSAYLMFIPPLRTYARTLVTQLD